jgi:hypothetical protein
VGAGATGTRGASGAALHREADTGAQATHVALEAALSREVGARAAGTHGAPGAYLRQEMGVGAQATRGGPGAALSREAGTTPPPPPSHPAVGGQGVAPSQSDRRCLYLSAILLGLPPRPLHDFDNHLDLGYLGIKGLSSACGTRQFLLQSQHSRHHDVATTGGVSSSNSTFDLFSSLTVCGAPAVTTRGC